MTHEVEIIHVMPGLREVFAELCRCSEKPAVAFFDQGIAREVSFKIGKEGKALFFILGIQVRFQEEVELVRLQFSGSIGKQFSGQGVVFRHAFQQRGEPGLLRAGKEGAGHDLLVKQPGLVEGRLFPEGHQRDDHAGGRRHAEKGIQKVGLSFTVAARKDHAVGAAALPDGFQSVADPPHHGGTRLCEAGADFPGRDAGTQGLDHVLRIKIRHRPRPPLPHIDLPGSEVRGRRSGRGP